jgi:hypothetical protein|tara:strand:- start:100 stop:378 length:279 start_codon:yes stop_codon:yes gene_type:complete
MNDEQKKEYFEFLVNSYDKGTASIKGNHPKEIKVAIDSFFKAAKMLVDHPEIGTIPPEYVNKLVGTLAQYPQYNKLAMDLIQIIQQDEEYDA